MMLVRVTIGGNSLELYAENTVKALELAGAIWTAASECDNRPFEVDLVSEEGNHGMVR